MKRGKNRENFIGKTIQNNLVLCLYQLHFQLDVSQQTFPQLFKLNLFKILMTCPLNYKKKRDFCSFSLRLHISWRLEDVGLAMWSRGSAYKVRLPENHYYLTIIINKNWEVEDGMAAAWYVPFIVASYILFQKKMKEKMR